VNEDMDPNKVAEATWTRLLEKIAIIATPVVLALLGLIWSEMSGKIENQARQMQTMSTAIVELSGKVDQGMVARLNAQEQRITKLESDADRLRDRLDAHITSDRPH
jgi:hypothetical protein